VTAAHIALVALAMVLGVGLGAHVAHIDRPDVVIEAT
jgi:hypothetical protein